MEQTPERQKKCDVQQNFPFFFFPSPPNVRTICLKKCDKNCHLFDIETGSKKKGS